MLLESLKKQQEVCNRKEQALRQMKMVLKFREDALRKIEKAQKEKMELSQDDKDDIIVWLSLFGFSAASDIFLCMWVVRHQLEPCVKATCV